jgi:hypothetical protein
VKIEAQLGKDAIGKSALNFNPNYASGFPDGDGPGHLDTKFDLGLEERIRRKDRRCT